MLSSADQNAKFGSMNEWQTFSLGQAKRTHHTVIGYSFLGRFNFLYVNFIAPYYS